MHFGIDVTKLRGVEALGRKKGRGYARVVFNFPQVEGGSREPVKAIQENQAKTQNRSRALAGARERRTVRPGLAVALLVPKHRLGRRRGRRPPGELAIARRSHGERKRLFVARRSHGERRSLPLL